MSDLQHFLLDSAKLHRHLCPRQVLGVRMGMLAGQFLDLQLPQENKRLLTFVETDGCFADGVAVSTNCWVGRRTLRVLDFGKVAATFVDIQTRSAVRIHPHPEARATASSYAPEARNCWVGYLLGYQRMPDERLLVAQSVTLDVSVEWLLSRPSARALCHGCGEEIINSRQVVADGRVLCRPCAGEGYLQPLATHFASAPLHVTAGAIAPQP